MAQCQLGSCNELSRHSATGWCNQRTLPNSPINVFNTLLFFGNSAFAALNRKILLFKLPVFARKTCVFKPVDLVIILPEQA
jgi:hypothetical protein